jgi:hypothetical protein
MLDSIGIWVNLLDILVGSKELETVWLVVGVAVPVGGPVLVWGSWHLVNSYSDLDDMC